MCRPNEDDTKHTKERSKSRSQSIEQNDKENSSRTSETPSTSPPETTNINTNTQRRSKFVKETNLRKSPNGIQKKKKKKKKKKENDNSNNGGIMSILPSLGLVVVGIFAFMAKRGFRGRPTTAGIDLGTTNSVICVQKPSKSVGTIECISDPYTNSPIIPSVVSFLNSTELEALLHSDTPAKFSTSNLPTPTKLYEHLISDIQHYYDIVLSIPNISIQSIKDQYESLKEKALNSPERRTPMNVYVGTKAKKRMDTHSKHTFYHSKRVIGRSHNDPSIEELRHEVPFHVQHNLTSEEDEYYNMEQVVFHSTESDYVSPITISSHILQYLIDLAAQFSPTYSSLSSAVIAIPAEFTVYQRQATMQAFARAGIKVTRILEEPTAAALAYGLDQKQGVEHVLVYDFGGGTLDVSVLRISPDGFVDVMASSGDSNLGGVDFDTIVGDYLLARDEAFMLKQEKDDDHNGLPESALEECAAKRFMHPCTETGIRTMSEQFKIELSTKYSDLIESSSLSGSLESKDDEIYVEQSCLQHRPSDQKSNDCSTYTTHTLKLTLAEYNSATSSLYPRSVTPIRKALENINMAPSDIDEVVMVGGTTRMPQIRSLVSLEFPQIQELNFFCP